MNSNTTNSNTTTKERVSEKLIDPTLLFRFELELKQASVNWTTKGLSLPSSCRLPSLGGLAGHPVFADVRAAWSEGGIAIHVQVSGKRQLPWCRDSRPEESDGFHLWIDTRCSPNIHRATQYCHRFLWMPAGAGARRDQCFAALVPINRARNNPKPVATKALKVAAAPRHDGYEMSGWVPASALTGFDPIQQPRVSFYYAVVDRELGWQTLSLGPELPVMEDPSLWAEAVLAR